MCFERSPGEWVYIESIKTKELLFVSDRRCDIIKPIFNFVKSLKKNNYIYTY